jgi:osmotically-inducible protein OsmY
MNENQIFPMKITCLFGVVSSMLMVAGCATSNGSRAAADRALEASMRSELDRYGDLAATEPSLSICARDGTVTLSGPVRTEKDREMIDTLARNTGGVMAVNDQLQVLYPPTGVASPYGAAPVYMSPPPEGYPPAPVIATGPAAVPGEYPSPRIRATTAADEPLAHRMIDQLSYDTVPAEWCQNVTISITGGRVYLQGTVGNEEQHHAIVSSAQHCRGVTAVYDHLQLR